jgi:uncharacterized repeat protein (TIGR03803 family)
MSPLKSFKQKWRRLLAVFSVTLLLLLPVRVGFSAPGEIQLLSSFAGGNGANPYSGLCLGPDGNYYGTTHQGGTNGLPSGLGSVYRLTPGGVVTTLHSFAATPNGNRPIAGLTLGTDGHLYGVTWQGGNSGGGTFFRFTTNHTLTTIFSFSSGGGTRPSGRLMLAQDGFFYGTTQLGGGGYGTVYRISTNGALSTVHAFNSTNGANPYAEVIQAPNGILYGTTVNGGSSNLGTVFGLTTNGVLTTLVTFTNANGANPYGGVVWGGDGWLYGTTAYGGANGYGTVYRVSTAGGFQTLHSFSGAADGANPWASLVRARDGRYYGTTILGGVDGWGTVFQVTTNANLTRLVSFDYDNNGATPYGALVQMADGGLLGTTFSQGVGLKGTVFKVLPAPATMSTALVNPTTFQLAWDAWPGISYQVQCRSNLSGSVWYNLGSPVISTTGTAVFVDNPLVAPSRFYRVQQLTSP